MIISAAVEGTVDEAAVLGPTPLQGMLFPEMEATVKVRGRGGRGRGRRTGAEVSDESLANALSALYPKGSEEKRLLDAMLLAVPR
ncbi:MAG: hypothetical protein ACFCVA_13335 [Gammaproteobacteria bacterium]